MVKEQWQILQSETEDAETNVDVEGEVVEEQQKILQGETEDAETNVYVEGE